MRQCEIGETNKDQLGFFFNPTKNNQVRKKDLVNIRNKQVGGCLQKESVFSKACLSCTFYPHRTSGKQCFGICADHKTCTVT
jgi:hypothetical protein